MSTYNIARTFTEREKQALNEFFNEPEIRNFLANNDYALIYKELRGTGSFIGVVTDFLLQNCNINPLLYMDEVPVFFAYDSSIKSINIPNNIKSIREGAFSACKELTNITIPNSVTHIGSGAFRSCDGMTEIIIPDSVTNIKGEVFSFCTGLTNITIGKGVTDIERWAFWNCPKLKNVYYQGSKEDWDKINIGANNNDLINANIITK